MEFDLKISEVKKIEKWIDQAGKKMLFYHNDSDGVCSATMLLKLFPESGFETCVCSGPIISDGFVKGLIEAKPDLMVFVDLPVDRDSKKLKKIQKAVPEIKIILIDHHIYYENLNSKYIIHINPMFKCKDYIPASLVVYRILQKMKKNPEPLLWVAAIGTIGDYGIECKDFLGECKKRYPKLLGNDPLKSKFWRASEMISHAGALKRGLGIRKSLEFMFRAKDFNDFVANPVLGGWEKEVEKEIERVKKQAEKNKERYGNVIVFTTDTIMGLNSEMATYFLNRYPDKVIIIRRLLNKGDSPEQWKLSIRCRTGTPNLNDVTGKAVKGIGNGGGHVKASGAVVNDWNKFLKRFVKLVNSS